MFLCVYKLSLCVSISVTGGGESWEELARVKVVRRFEMSWERGEMSWAEVRSGGKSWGGGKRWEELRQVEKSEGKVGRGESRWKKSREEVKRVELRRGGMEQFWTCWKELQKLRRTEVVWAELRSGGHNWKGVTQNDGEFREQSCEAVKFHGSP